MSRESRNVFEQAKRWANGEKGQGLVEYALILVLIAIVVMAAVKVLGTTASSQYTNISSTLSGQ